MRTSKSETENFGFYLSSLMRSRGIKSDEQLARKAMRLQTAGEKRINVQRRTINNWRNNKSFPRSTTDRQYCLVLEALDATPAERQQLTKLLGLRAEAMLQNNGVRLFSSESVKRWASASIFLLCITLIGLFYFGSSLINPVAARDEILEIIPPGKLKLSAPGFVLPQSDVTAITARHLEGLNSWELYVARNEIFARHGRRFTKNTSICLQNHFDSLGRTNKDGWYASSGSDIFLSEIERKNALAIRNYECHAHGGQMNCTGQLHAC